MSPLRLFCTALLLAAMPCTHAQVVDSSLGKECVIVLHGLGRTAASTRTLAKALERAGYHVSNNSYASTEHPIADLAQDTIESGLALCQQANAAPVHFVTHSMGGILLRQFLQENEIEQLGRIVMLSPPNHGSEVVDLLKNNAVFQWALGPAALSLGTDSESLPRQLGPIAGEIGIITGNKSSDPWFSPVIPGSDDGKVSVTSARLDEMADFLVLPVGHTFIVGDQQAIEQVLHFLAEGRFRHASESDPSESQL